MQNLGIRLGIVINSYRCAGDDNAPGVLIVPEPDALHRFTDATLWNIRI